MENRFTSLKRWGILLWIIFLSTFANAQWVINEGFESETFPAGWTYYDANNDGSHWRPRNHAYAHTGNYMCFVDCFSNNGNDWIVTPQIAVQSDYIFTFYARSWFSTEKMNVKLSTTGNAINNFNVTLQSVTGLGNSYVEYTYDLSAYVGQNVYLAIQWVEDNYALVIDDVKVGAPEAYDVGLLSITSPINHNLINTPIIPSVTIKNYGTSSITSDFPVGCIITNSSGSMVYSDTVSHTGAFPSGTTDVVNFQAWQSADTGLYHVNMFSLLANDAVPNNDTLSRTTHLVMHYGTGGPDSLSYRWIDSGEPSGPAYNWIEISNTGASTITYGVTGFYGDDNFSEPIPIGFDFPFYGINRSQFYADINGTLLLADNQWYKEYPSNGWHSDGNIFNYTYPIPGYSEMPALISVYWDDLYADEGTGNIYYQTFGTAPNRYCVIEWNNLRFAAGTGGTPTLCFEAILYENGEIAMQYKNVANGQTGSPAIHDYGQSATVAIQNDEGTVGLCYLREIVENNQYIGPEPPGNLLKNNMAIKFYMGEDTQAPIMASEDVWNTFNHTPEITATILDISGISSDTLYYNIGNGWQSMTHTSFEAPNIYHYQLPSIPSSSTISYYFAATDNSTNHNRGTLPSNIPTEYFSFKILPTAGVNILFLTPGNKPGYQDYQNKEYPKYINALDLAGVDYDVYNWAEYPSYRFPDCYNIIFAYSNSSGNSAIHDTLSVALMNFLDSGTETSPKNLFLASDNMAKMQYPEPNAKPLKKFFTAYIRGEYIAQVNPPIFGGDDGIGGPDSIGFASGSIKGLAGTPIGETDEEINVYADSPDVIMNGDCPEWYANEVTNPEINSWGSYVFEDGPFDGDAYSKGNGCAIWLDDLIYKSYFLSFDISQFTNNNDINSTIEDALEWFGLINYTITATSNPPGGGMVTGAGTYAGNTTATLTATPQTGYNFVKWTENGSTVSNNSVYSFVVTSNRNLVANFELQTFNVITSSEPAEGGTTTGSGYYSYGYTATVTATPEQGYDFINWTENGTVLSTAPVYSFIVVTDHSLVATFENQTNTYTVTAIANPEEGGTITGAGNYVANSTATLVATPDTGYNFVNWTENGTIVSTDLTYSFEVTSNRSLVANFEIQAFVITANVYPVESGTVTGEGTFNYNETVTLTAIPGADYLFVNWMENGTEVSTDSIYSFSAIANRSLTANFTPKVSVPERDMASEIKVYPNPADGYFALEFPSGIINNVFVKIKNIQGQILGSYSLSNVASNSKVFNVSYLTKGLYFAEIYVNNAIIIKKIIIK
ncbi:MAG: choice-of-anchor J domain-containing protein [Lentimicrobiaceae bacterium]|nr:choice-of-anchor J domain-containing protein [Lentimicrobiaceae bacterium]